MTNVRVKVLFFGILKEIVGTSEEQLEVGEGEPLGRIFDRYTQRFPRMKAMASSIVLARNQQFCDRTSTAAEGDEIAFLPPVSGGSQPTATAGNYSHEISDERCFFALTRGVIDASGIARQILRGEDGAIVNFEGVVRNNTQGRVTRFLDYECYEAMAIKVMADIGRDIAGAWPIGRLAMVHRLGRMEIGDTSVAVVVTAPHRKPAFEAALEGINRLKRLVPIWKKEYFADGEIWVEGAWDASVLNR
jgi:molybdopterin synthase catalytic subunit/molybdopterin converting factor small subunit